MTQALPQAHEKASSPARYAVFGHPVAHSKSPFIHARFAEACGQDMVYTAVDVQPGDFETEVGRFFVGGGAGLNITVPFKQRAWQLAADLSERARMAGAVNTLYLDEQGGLRGDNTDGVGLVRDITRNHGGSLDGARVLILGAGGAVRGVLPALLAENPASITIANRTLARAEELVSLFSGNEMAGHCKLASSHYEELSAPAYSFIINGTSAGLEDQMPTLPDAIVAPDTWCYDMVYGDTETVFQRWAIAHGAARALAGLGMLVEQAAEAFFLWRGVRPDTTAVIDLLSKGA